MVCEIRSNAKAFDYMYHGSWAQAEMINKNIENGASTDQRCLGQHTDTGFRQTRKTSPQTQQIRDEILEMEYRHT